GAVRFTYIGYFGAHKGIDLVMDALHLLPRCCKIAVNLVGEGDLAGHIRGRVHAAGLNSIVKFWGKLEHSRIEEAFEQTDVLILPSIWPENQPVSITEAMAARTPVIASAIGGVPELVIDGYNGYLFQPGSARDLARKMRQFVANPDRLASFGENGFKVIRNKSFEQQLDKICKVYE
ncbi:MAG: glycosyltransferase family 4 protein, partial [Terriglobia bacterium]